MSAGFPGFDPNMLIDAMRTRLAMNEQQRDRGLREQLANREFSQRDRAMGLDEQRFGESQRQFNVNTELTQGELGLRGHLGTEGLRLEGQRNDIAAASQRTEAARVGAATRALQAEQAMREALANNMALTPEQRALGAAGYAPPHQPQMNPAEALAYGQIQEQFGNQSLTPEAQQLMLQRIAETQNALSPPRQGVSIEERLLMQAYPELYNAGGGGQPPVQPGAAAQGLQVAPSQPLPPVGQGAAGPQQGQQLAASREQIMAELQQSHAQGMTSMQATQGIAQRYGPQVVQQYGQDPEILSLGQQLWGGQGGEQQSVGSPAEALAAPSPLSGRAPGRGPTSMAPVLPAPAGPPGPVRMGGKPGGPGAPTGQGPGPSMGNKPGGLPTEQLGSREFLDAVSQNPQFAQLIANALRQRQQGTLQGALARTTPRRPPMMA